MQHVRKWIDREDEEAGANRQTASLAGLAAALAIVVVSLFLVRTLRTEVAMENCMLAAHPDCAVLVGGAHP